MKLDVFCLDVDGVMTDGTFLYSRKGKQFKRFGPEDGDALRILRRYLNIRFVTADHRGLKITRARIERDLGFQLELVAADKRLEWLAERYSLDCVAYMGDSFLDAPILKSVAVGIAPSNGSVYAQNSAEFTTQSRGGQGAVAEACFWLADLIGAEPKEFNP